jgi:hypothetical protein
MPLAFAFLGVAALFVISGLKGGTIADAFAGRLSDPLNPKGGLPTPEQILGVDTANLTDIPGANIGGLVGGNKQGANPALLIACGKVAESQFHLRVSECKAPGAPASWGPVHPVHVPGSDHYVGRAFDCSGTEANMHAFCVWLVQNHKGAIKQLIHNPGFAIDHGHDVGAAFFAAVWAGHAGHVHLAF